MLKIFGCLCFATNLAPTDKFAPRSIKCVFLGFPYAKKGYRFMDLSTRKCFITRNVQFIEHIFSFQSMINVSSPSSLFMFPPTPDDILVENSDPLQQPSVDTSPTSDSSSNHLPITFDSSESASLHS